MQFFSFLRHLILLVFLLHFGECFLRFLFEFFGGLFKQFGGVFGRRNLVELDIFSHESQFLAVVKGGIGLVLLENGVAFFFVLAQELVDSFIAAEFRDFNLVAVPRVVKHGFNVAQELAEVLFVERGALSADKRAVSNIRVRAPVLLAVDAECVELVLLDQASQEVLRAFRLNVMLHFLFLIVRGEHIFHLLIILKLTF